jgi:hypothetical protein
MEELNKCNCGSNVKIILDEDRSLFGILCFKCGIKGATFFGTKEETIFHWNKTNIKRGQNENLNR